MLVEQLPRHSRFAQALADDDELAARVVDRPDQPTVPTVRVTEWTPEREELAVVSDRIGELIAVTIATRGGRPPKIPPRPRPRTALQRAAARRRRIAHEQLAARVLHRPTTTGRE